MWWSARRRLALAAVEPASGVLMGWFGRPREGFELVSWSEGAFHGRVALPMRCLVPGEVRWLPGGDLAIDGDARRRLIYTNGLWSQPREISPASSPRGESRFSLGRIYEYCVGSSFTRDGDEMEEWRSEWHPWSLVIHSGQREEWLDVGDARWEERLLCATWLDDNRLVVLSNRSVIDVDLRHPRPRAHWVDWPNAAPQTIVSSGEGEALWVGLSDGRSLLVRERAVVGELPALATRALARGRVLVRDDGLVLSYGGGPPLVWRPGAVELTSAKLRRGARVVGASLGRALSLVHDDGEVSPLLL